MYRDLVAKIWNCDPEQIDLTFIKNVFRFVVLDHPIPVIAIAVSNEGRRLYEALSKYAYEVAALVSAGDTIKDPGFDFYIEGLSMAYTALYNFALGMLQASCIALRTSLEAIVKGLIANSLYAYNTVNLSRLLERLSFEQMLKFLRTNNSFKNCINKYRNKLREAYYYLSDYAHAHGMARRVVEGKGLSSYPLPRIIYEPGDEEEFKKIASIVENLVEFVKCVNDVYTKNLRKS